MPGRRRSGAGGRGQDLGDASGHHLVVAPLVHGCSASLPEAIVNALVLVTVAGA